LDGRRAGAGAGQQRR